MWLASGIYPKTLVGLGSCYVAALPFLHNSLIGDMVWGLVIFWGFNFVVNTKKIGGKDPKLQCATIHAL